MKIMKRHQITFICLLIFEYKNTPRTDPVIKRKKLDFQTGCCFKMSSFIILQPRISREKNGGKNQLGSHAQEIIF